MNTDKLVDTDKIIETDQNDFIEELNSYNSKNNIVNQLPAYNIEETDYFIKNLEIEYEQQKTLNSILKKNDTSKEIEKIKKFIDDNNSNIDVQLDKLINLSRELENIVLENKELQENNDELKKITNSEKYNQIAKKLKSIKKTKENIKDFLGQNGIISII